MIILGLNENHNSTAAIIKDGEVIYCASEERITRDKNDVGYPLQAINEGLKETGLKKSDINFVTFSFQTAGNPLELKIKRITRFSISDYVREMREHWKPILIDKKPSTSFWKDILEDPKFNKPNTKDYYNFDFLKTAAEKDWPGIFNQERKKVVVKHLGIDPSKISFIKHHEAHAHYAYYAAPIDRNTPTAVITADGWGDGANGSIYRAENGKLKKIYETQNCNLARIYRYITLLLGMKPHEHEYKVMGLAPYAKDYLSARAYAIFKKTLVVNGLDFKWDQKPNDLYFHFQKELEGIRFDGIAGGLQLWLEELLTKWVSNIIQKLKVDSAVFSGGLSMNVKANKAITEIPELKNFFVCGSGGDESTAIGGAYALSNQYGLTPKPLRSMYLGYTITELEIESLLSQPEVQNTCHIKKNVSLGYVANLLAKNKIIARCSGPMEFGARALGNRSILANPAAPENIPRVNQKIIYGDFWMPFTPSILDTRAPDYLVNPKKLAAPIMTVGFDTTKLGKEHLKAALHPADLTARPQVLSRQYNPEYYDLIKEFETITGIGALLNTSFNLHGEPIVRNTGDAWHTFTNSGLDALLLNNTLLIKKGMSV